MKQNGPLALFILILFISFQLQARLTQPEEDQQKQIQSEQHSNLLSRCIAGVVKEGYGLAFAQDICGRVFSQNSNDQNSQVMSLRSCMHQLRGSMSLVVARDLCSSNRQTQNQINSDDIIKTETNDSHAGAEI